MFHFAHRGNTSPSLSKSDVTERARLAPGLWMTASPHGGSRVSAHYNGHLLTRTHAHTERTVQSTIQGLLEADKESARLSSLQIHLAERAKGKRGHMTEPLHTQKAAQTDKGGVCSQTRCLSASGGAHTHTTHTDTHTCKHACILFAA